MSPRKDGGVTMKTRSMQTTPWSQGLRLGLLTVIGVTLGGCVDYTIETTLNPDGSGSRYETMNVTKNEDLDLPPHLFRDLMFASDRHGWAHETVVDEAGDTVQVLERSTEIRGLGSWSDLSETVLIRGAASRDADTPMGYLTLGEVQFHNSVQVGTGTLSDGRTQYTYREVFRWENGFDVIVEFFMGDFDRTLKARYPRLTDSERGGIVGFTRAELWSAVNEGLLDGDDEDRLIGVIVDRTTEHASKVIGARYPNANPDVVRNTLSQILSGETEGLETLFEETLPGLNLGFNTAIVFRLTMPGTVTHSNARETDGETLVWEFGPTDALAQAVEIVAESVEGG
jgi:hypothetical protein